MTETKTEEVKVEKTKIPSIIVEGIEGNYLTTNIGFKRGADITYGIEWLIPETEDTCQGRYGCKLADLIEAGVRKLSTAPNYSTVMFSKDGTLLDGGHQKGQDLADDYKPGVRKASATSEVKAKASALDAITKAAEAGSSLEEIKAMIAKLAVK